MLKILPDGIKRTENHSTMIKIRGLKPKELKQVLSLLKRSNEIEPQYAVLQKWQQLYIPLQRFSQLLPIHLQFMPAIFVAVSREKVLGLVWLSKDGKQARRWKVDQLILDPEAISYDVGTQLVNYVINRYGGDGVQTFLAFVDQHYNTALGLLKTCGFRHCTRVHAFSCGNPSTLPLDHELPSGLRSSGNEDASKLANLYQDLLPVEAKVCLQKSRLDYYKTIPEQLSERFKGRFSKRWVTEDAARDVITSSVLVTTDNFQDFYLNLMVSPGWSELEEGVLQFALQQVLQTTSSARLHIECFEFQKQTVELLERLGFQRNAITEVLVKDYWIPIEDKGIRLQSPILLFSGKTSPAVNFR